MTRFTSWRVGAVAVAAGLLVAACSGGGGGGGSETSIGAVGTASNAAPTGISGGSGSASGSKSASKTAKASGSRSASRSGSSTPAHASSSSRHTGGGGSHSSSSAHVDNGCRSSAPPLSSDPSKASITICKAVGLSSGQSVTITGHSFKPNESLVVAQCRYKGENADNYGLADCNIKNVLTFSPAKTTRSDGSGNVGPVTVPVYDAFKKINCRTDQCLISVAVPLQSSAADNPHVLISFG